MGTIESRTRHFAEKTSQKERGNRSSRWSLEKVRVRRSKEDDEENGFNSIDTDAHNNVHQTKPSVRWVYGANSERGSFHYGPKEGCILYAAGRFVVLYDTLADTQQIYRNKSPVTSLCTSLDGKRAAFGSKVTQSRRADIVVLNCLHMRPVVTLPGMRSICEEHYVLERF